MKRALLAGAGVVLAGVAAIVAVNAIADQRDADLARRWSALDPGAQNFERRPPVSLANQTALELERRAAALGIDLATPDMPGRPSPPCESSNALQPISRAANDYLFRQVLADRDVIAEPKGDFGTFLHSHEPELDALEIFLVGSPPPTWEDDRSRGAQAPVPNLLGQLNLQRLLLARALDRARMGDQQRALRSLEASWQLETALLERSEEISYLIALSMAKLQAGALRRTDAEVSVWKPRLNAQSWWRRYVAVVHRQEWQFGRHVRSITLGKMLPIGRLWASDYSDLLASVVSNLHRQNPCQFTMKLGRQVWERPLGRTNFMGRMSLPRLEESSHRLFRAQIELEGTEKILEAKEARRLSGTWPAELPGLESSVCPGSRWIYEVNSDGSATISFEDGFEDWPRSSLMRLPLRFTVKRSLEPATRS